MNINDYIMGRYKDNWEYVVKNSDIKISIRDEYIYLTWKEIFGGIDKNDAFYLYCLIDSYRNGPKSISPTYEQSMVFENIEAKITLDYYNQIYPTVITELSEEYRSSLQSRYKIAPPRSIFLHFNHKEKYLLSAVFFKILSPVIVMYISPKHRTHPLEEAINISLDRIDDMGPDYEVSSQVLRMAINLNLFAVNYGHQKTGYKNIKQHRFLERNKPLEAKKDIEYFSLKQEIKLFNRERYPKNDSPGTHASPKPHWRRGFNRVQHYGPNNSMSKVIFIMPTFVCGDDFKGPMSNTEVSYK